MKLDELELLITANTVEVENALEDIKDLLQELILVSDKSSEAMDSPKGLSGSMFKANLMANLATKAITFTINAVKKLISATVGLVKNLMESGSQLARLRTATEVVARNMGISSEEVDGLRKSLAESNTYGSAAENTLKSLMISGIMPLIKEIDSLVEANKKLPPELQVLADSLKYVDGRTGDTQEGINALVLAMKDLSAAANKSSREGIEQLTKFIQGQNGVINDGILQIGNLGTEFRQFETILGKSRSQFTAQEEAIIRMNIVMREAQKVQGAYAETYTSSGKMISSIGDATKAVFEELGAALEPIWASVSSAVLNFVNGVRTFILDNYATIQAWATKVAGTLVSLIRIIGSILSRLPLIGGYFQKLADFQVKVGATAKTGAEAQQEQADAMNDTASGAKALKKELMGLAGFDEMNTLTTPADSSGGGSLGGAGITPDIAQEQTSLFGDIGRSINDFADNAKKKFEEVKKKVLDFFQPMIDLWNKWVKPAWDGLIATLNELWQSIQDSPVGEIMKTLGQVIGVIVVGAIAALIYIITGVVALIKLWFDNWKKRWNETVEALAQLIVRFRDFKNKASEVWNYISAKVKALWSSAMAYVRAKIDEVKNAISTRIANIRAFFSGLFTHVSDIWNNIKSKAHGAFDSVKSKVYTIVQNIKDKLSGLKDGFKGIADGIVTFFKKPINKLIDLINAFFGTLNRTKLPEWTGLGNVGFNIPGIPHLAQGGQITGDAIFRGGEGGYNEVVLPLDRNTEWADKVADLIAENGSGGAQTIIVKIGEDTLLRKVIRGTNQRARQTNSLILNA